MAPRELIVLMLKDKGIPEEWITQVSWVPNYDAVDVILRISGPEQVKYMREHGME